MQKAFGFSQQGAQEVQTLAYSSSNVFQETFPFAQITVYVNGTVNLATIFVDNLGTPLGNPFTSNAQGWWFFYAPDGRYDVLITPTATANAHCPLWIRDILLQDTLALLQQMAKLAAQQDA